MELRRFLREPLVHFVVLGALLFATERMWGRRAPPRANLASAIGSATPDARIVVTAEVKRALSEEFTRAYGHAPSTQEAATLVDGWIDEEVLYREGVAHGFEREDPAVRRRVAQQMSFVLESGAAPPDPGDAELRAWFSAHPERFKKSELVDLVRNDAQSAKAASDFAAVRDEVKHDWLKTKRAELHAAAIAGLRKRWTIETAP